MSTRAQPQVAAPTPVDCAEVSRHRIQQVRRSLLRWGRDHFRSFPWRADRDLYRTLITEILLKQTTAERVVPVRQELVTRFPDPQTLAEADSAELISIIKSLGFGGQRTAQLMALGRALVAKPLRRTPSSRLAELPGVGPYTAAAVSCFVWGRPEPALDVNVARIVMRLFAVRVIRGEPRRNRRVDGLARQLVAGPRPREMNWALLDLGAEVCRPAPLCGACPLAHVCSYASQAPWHRDATVVLPE